MDVDGSVSELVLGTWDYFLSRNRQVIIGYLCVQVHSSEWLRLINIEGFPVKFTITPLDLVGMHSVATLLI